MTNKILHGRPFVKTTQHSGKTFFSENKLLNRIRPSKSNSRFSLFVSKVLKKIASFTKNSLQHLRPYIIRSGIRISAKLPIGFDGYREAYEQFLKNESTVSPKLMKAFSQLVKNDKQRQDIEAKRVQVAEAEKRAESNKGNTKLKKAFDLKKKQLAVLEQTALKKAFNEAARLKPGEIKIVRLHPISPVLCLLSKGGQGLNLDIVGSGVAMQALLEAEAIGHDQGKEKVTRRIRYEGIPLGEAKPGQFLFDILKESLGVEGVSLPKAKEFLAKISGHQKAVKVDKMTVADQSDKLFWNVVERFMPEDNHSKERLKRLKLKGDLAQLFQAFGAQRIELKPASEDFRKLQTMHQAVSYQLQLAFEKGEVSEQELEEITQELKVIDLALMKAQRPKTNAIPTKISLPAFVLKNVQATDLKIVPPQKCADKTEVGEMIRGRAPVQAAIAIQGMAPIDIQPYTQIQTAHQCLETFDRLFNAWEKGAPGREKNVATEELFLFFSQLPFNLLKKSGVDYKRSDSFWWNFPAEKAEGMMEKIAQFTEATLKRIDKNETTQFQYECFVKIDLITRLLTSKTTGYWIEDYKHRMRAGEWERIPVYQNPRRIKDTGELAFNLKFHHLLPTQYANGMGSENGKLETIFFSEKDIKVAALQPLIRVTNALYAHFVSDQEGPHVSFSPGGFAAPSWLRPIEDPFLLALYGLTVMNVEAPKNVIEGRNVPEAFHHDPEGLWQFYLNELKIKDPESVAGLMEAIHFQPEEMKALSRLLGSDQIHVELVAFMREQTVLMRNPNVRHFFEGLLLNEGKYSWELKKYEPKTLAHAFAQEIERNLRLLQGELQGHALQNPELSQSRLDLLLFYLDVSMKLAEKFKNDGKEIAGLPTAEAIVQIIGPLQKQCEKFPELKVREGVMARVRLRALLSEVPIQENRIGAILNEYARVLTLPVDSKLLDPCFEEQMKHSLHTIMRAFEKRPELLPVDKVQGILDLLCHGKKLPLDASPWVHVKGLSYQNGQYQVDLLTWQVSMIGQKSILDRLPEAVIVNPIYQRLFGKQWMEKQTVQVEETAGATVYAFRDPKGGEVQIEHRQGRYALYRKAAMDGGKWVQKAPAEIFAFDGKEKKGKKRILSFFEKKVKPFLNLLANKTRLPFLENDLYLDPANPLRGLVLNAEGGIDFEVLLKETKQGLTISGLFDLRGEKRQGPWQVNNAGSVKRASLGFLESFENLNEVLLYTQKGQLKKIELYRYGLSFELEKGHLTCLTEPYKGYIVNPHATLKEKQGMVHALMLEHPNPNKPKKLLVSEAKSLNAEAEQVMPTAKGLGKIALLVHWIQMAFQMLKGRMPQFPIALQEKLDGKSRKLSFASFDLRPLTGELCVTSRKEREACLDLVKQALFLNDPFTAMKMIEKMDLKADLLTPSFLEQLFRFINEKQGQSKGAEAALKLKLSFKLMDALKDTEKYSLSLKDRLHQFVANHGRTYYQEGRKVPAALLLNEFETERLARQIGKKEQEFFLKSSFKPEAWKKAKPAHDKGRKIAQLEGELAVGVKLKRDELDFAIPKLPAPAPLLYNAQDVASLFDLKQPTDAAIKLLMPEGLKPFERKALQEAQANLDKFKEGDKITLKTNGKSALKTFRKKNLLPLKLKKEAEAAKLKMEIETLLRSRKDAKHQLALFANPKAILDFEALRLDFVQGRLEGELKDKMTRFYEAVCREKAAEAALKLVDEILAIGNPKMVRDWEIKSQLLHRLLTISRRYDSAKEPRLLVFEAQTFINFKQLEGGLDQLDLLEQLLGNSDRIVQAPTGSGKSSVLSVMRSLLKANGKNLVIQKVLPSLLPQTQQQLEANLGGLYKQLVYPFRFNLKKKMTREEIYREKNAQGILEEKKRETSIFKGIYLDMLEVIQNKGCILTDYKSLPLIEEKFIKLGQELVELSIQGREASPLQMEHYNYLRKILLLLEMKADENMDEFDAPNRTNQKIQLDLAVGAQPVTAYKIDTSLEIYGLLLQDPALGLIKNIQGDLSEETRQGCLNRAAQKMAERLSQGDQQYAAQLYRYFLGESEDALQRAQHDPNRDKIAFCKDQFSIYLPLSICKKRGSDYDRSEDGMNTVPCRSGEKQEAKFGTVCERMNFAIQDYMQGGITRHDLMLWFNQVKNRWQEEQDPAKRAPFEEECRTVFKEKTIQQCIQLSKTAEGCNELLREVNRDPRLIYKFLEARLRKMTTSGSVISMDPQNIVDMSRVVSGISATIGAPDSLHPQFKVNSDMNGRIQASMVRRIIKRAAVKDVLAYDPEHPEKMLQGANVHAVIDGAGAFNEGSAKAAEELLKSNPALKQAGYHGEEREIQFVGRQTGSIEETGFYFAQAQTRGTDITLSTQAKAILTLSEKDGMRDYAQKEGRLRNEMQTYQLAVSKHQKITTVDQGIAHAFCVDSRVDAKDIFRGCKQTPQAAVRKAMKRKLLTCVDYKEFVALFQRPECRRLFISDPEPALDNPGEYFNARSRIQKENMRPQDALNELKVQSIAIARQFKLEEAAKEIEAIQYPPELLEKMPPLVSPIGAQQGELEMELQVEQEEEQEQELELEVEMENEEERPLAREPALYPARVHSNLTHSAKEKIHPAYDPMIKVTDAFLPFSREGTASQFKRRAFDPSMYKIGRVIFSIQNSGEFIEARLEDPLYDYQTEKMSDLVYDIRTGQFLPTRGLEEFRMVEKKVGAYMIPEFRKITPEEYQAREPFARVISQVKFLDGRTDGYSDTELAALEAWLKQHGPKAMKEHFLNDVLRHRHEERKYFESSQLGQLFKRLIA